MNIFKIVVDRFKAGSKITKVSSMIIAAAFVVGVSLKMFTNKIDHPVEQVIEHLLRLQGVHYDFSAHQKPKEDK